MSTDPKLTTRMMLAFVSLGKCAECAHALFQDDPIEPTHIGECAHIRGENPTAARYDPGMTDEERRAFSNLLYLCPGCHTLIDKQVTKYTVEYLLEKKGQVLRKYRVEIGNKLSVIGFTEVEIVCKALVGNGRPPAAVDLPTPVLEKMRKNDLCLDETRVSLETGLGRAPIVREFLDRHGELYPGFSENLKAGFRSEYVRGIADGFSGDELFYMLHAFACPTKATFGLQIAAMAVLCYLFEACEIFEP